MNYIHIVFSFRLFKLFICIQFTLYQNIKSIDALLLLK